MAGTSDAEHDDALAPSGMDVKLLKSLKKDLSLLPCNQSAMSRCVAAIRRIDRIEIPNATKYHGATYYTIHIFYKTPQSNIPTARSIKAQGILISQAPDVVVTQRFSEFSGLRQAMYYHALMGHVHDFCPCSLCGNMVKLLEHSRAQPRLRIKLFQRRAVVCTVLQSFLNSVLHLVADTSPSSRFRCGCQGQDILPLLLHAFLLSGRDGDQDTVRQSGVNCPSQR